MTVSPQALFIALLKQSTLQSVEQLTRWLGVLSTALLLMLTLFPDSTLYSELRYVPRVPPQHTHVAQ